MTKINDGGPAFPIPPSNIVRDGYQSISTGARGMSLRDWFAGQALIGILSSDILMLGLEKHAKEENIPAHEAIAISVFELADMMVKEREK